MATNRTATETPNTSDSEQPELPRLLRALRRDRGSAFFFARTNTRILRDKLIATVQEQLDKAIAVVRIVADPEQLVDTQIQRAIADSPAPVVFVLDLETYLSGLDVSLQQRVVQELNWRRGALARLGRSLVFWLPDFAINLLAREAPDFFDWRSGVYEFGAAGEVQSQGMVEYSSMDGYQLLNLNVEEKSRRIETLESLLQSAEQERTGESQEVLRFEHDLAQMLAQQGNVNRALQLWQDVLKLYNQFGDVRGKASTLNNIANLIAQQGDISHALELWQDALKHHEEIGDTQGKAATLNSMGSIIAQQGDINRALQLWQDALKLVEQIGDLRGKAATIHHIASATAQQGDTDRALQLWQDSLKLYEQIGDVKGKATTLNNMAGIIAQEGDLDRALQLMKNSLALKEQIGDVRGKAVTLGNMGWLANHQGDLEKAHSYNIEAARSLSAVRAWLDLSMALENLGTLGEGGQAGNPAYLAQAFWLCLFTGVPVRNAINSAGSLLQRIGLEHATAPLIAATALLLVDQRGKDHPEFQKLQQQASALIAAGAEARGIPEDKASEWFNNERLNDPDHVIPAVKQALVEIVGDTEWLFDRQAITER